MSNKLAAQAAPDAQAQPTGTEPTGFFRSVSAAVWRPRQPPPPEKVSDDSADDDSKTKAASQADLDNSGTIDYTEFVAAMLHLNKAQKEDHMFAAFIYFDKDGSGYITSDELQHACKQFGLEGGQLEGIMHEVDKDNDGRIDYSEFVAMMQDTGLDRGFQNLKSIGLRNTYGW